MPIRLQPTYAFALILATGILLSSCRGVTESQRFTDKIYVSNLIGCSFENFVWENTDERAARTGFAILNWHITQCLGRDPEPMRCHQDILGGIRGGEV